MVKKKSPGSLSSIGSFSHSSQDVDLPGFVVSDDQADDLEPISVDAMDARREFLLRGIKRDIDRPANEFLFDEDEYQRRMKKLDSKDMNLVIPAYRAKHAKKAKGLIASVSRSKSATFSPVQINQKNMSLSLSRGYKPMSLGGHKSPARSAPTVYRNPTKAAYRSLDSSERKEAKQVRKDVVALFATGQEVFQHNKKKGILGIEDPLGMLIAATGCLPENMFYKGLESEDQEELDARSSLISQFINGGDRDQPLKWLITLNHDQLKLIISHIYTEHLWSIPATPRNEEKRQLREGWLAFLLYLVSRCLGMLYEDFARDFLDMLG